MTSGEWYTDGCGAGGECDYALDLPDSHGIGGRLRVTIEDGDNVTPSASLTLVLDNEHGDELFYWGQSLDYLVAKQLVGHVAVTP